MLTLRQRLAIFLQGIAYELEPRLALCALEIARDQIMAERALALREHLHQIAQRN